MIRTFFATLGIMLFLGALLLFGIYTPDLGKKVYGEIVSFLKWRPVVKQGPLNETEQTIKDFDESFRSLRSLRSMVVTRNKQSNDQLEQTYNEVRQNLKQLLWEMDQQSVSGHIKLMDTFKNLHVRRRDLVVTILDDERTLITINDQMDAKLREISSWLSQQALNPASMTTDEMSRGQQYENLLKGLKAFAAESNDLDVLRLVLMRKSHEFVDQLEASNTKLEENFTALSMQVENATTNQAQGLWDEYERLEKEQREIISGMRLNQDFIGDNQLKITNGIKTIAQDIHYRSDDQLQRFKQGYDELEQKRRAVVESIQHHQQIMADAKLNAEQLKQSTAFLIENSRMKTEQMLLAYEEVEEYRRSLSSTINTMMDELRANDQDLENRIEAMRAMRAQSPVGNAGRPAPDLAEVSQRSRESMNRSMQKIADLRSRMEAANNKLDSYVKKGVPDKFQANPNYMRLQELHTRNKVTLELMRRGEDQMNNAQERQQAALTALKDRLASMDGAEERMRAAVENQKANTASLKDRINDLISRNKEKMESQKEKSQEQARIQREKVQDQMQRMKDQQLSREK